MRRATPCTYLRSVALGGLPDKEVGSPWHFRRLTLVTGYTSYRYLVLKVMVTVGK